MKSLSLLALATLFLSIAQAHNLLTTLYVNGVKQGDGTCVREGPARDNANSPVIDFTSDDMACGVGGEKPVAYTCPAPAGAKLTFEYRVSPERAGSGFIDPSHKGPVSVYAKQLASAAAAAAGPGWFKLWGEGYDAAADLWATEKFMATDGLISIELPAALPAGRWLFRPEVVALHNVTPAPEPQFYVGCAQVFLESAAAAGPLDVPPDRSVSIPGYLHAGDPGLTYNIYQEEEDADPKVPYPGLGPAPFTPPAPSLTSSPTSTSHANENTPDEGGVPPACLLVNANWCGVEVPPYADAGGCWAAARACWSQHDACWDQAPASGGRNCDVWRGKCEDLEARCADADADGDSAGPPAFALENNDWPPPGPIPDAVNAVPTGGSGSGEEEEEEEVSLMGRRRRLRRGGYGGRRDGGR